MTSSDHLERNGSTHHLSQYAGDPGATGEKAMHLRYFADSYGYVEKAVIHAIAEPQEWVVHPMLFRAIDGGHG